MKIILKDMSNKTIKTIRDFNRDNYYSHSPKILSVEYNDNYKLFDKLNQDAIVLKPCKNSKDFIIEHISQNHIDFINSNNRYDAKIDYSRIIGRYFTKVFPFVDDSKIMKLFNDVVKTKKPYEFRELMYIEDILISSYRHKIFYSNDKIFHLAYFEDDLELLSFREKEFFENSKRPYILMDGKSIIKANNQFLDYFNIKEIDILGEFDLKKIDLIDIDLDEFKSILNNLLNRNCLFEIFEFSIMIDNNIKYLRAYACPSSYESKPVVKMFFEEISQEKKYEIESHYLQNTLDLVQNTNSLACFFKEKEEKTIDNSENNHFEENIIDSKPSNENIEFIDIEDIFKKKTKSNDMISLLMNETIFSKGIINILELDSDSKLNEINLIDYIIDDDKEEFLSELKCFSKNYNLINTNFRIKVQDDLKENNLKNKDVPYEKEEKYINFILEGKFNENGDLIDYNGFLKDFSDLVYKNKKSDDKIYDVEDLLDKISE